MEEDEGKDLEMNRERERERENGWWGGVGYRGGGMSRVWDGRAGGLRGLLL